MPFTSRTPTYLTPEQRYALTQIPADLSYREIAPHYTFTQKDLDLIRQRRRLHNRLGFAVQLAVLRFPGRPLKDLAGIPARVLAAIADQVQVPAMGSVITRCMNTWMRSGAPTNSVSVGGASTCGSLANCFHKRWKAIVPCR